MKWFTFILPWISKYIKHTKHYDGYIINYNMCATTYHVSDKLNNYQLLLYILQSILNKPNLNAI